MFIVESHHHVLAAWAQLRRSLEKAPRLLTLDHHTDTSAPFRNRLRGRADFAERQREWLAAIDFQKPDSVEVALTRLSHDEHVTTAIKTGIISSALVIAHNAMDTGRQVYEEHRIICRSVSRTPGARTATREECDNALDSAFLTKMLESFDQALEEASEPALREQPYILDLDLDYLNTRLSIAPKSAHAIRALAAGAALVTIATEPAHVRSCSLDPGLESEELLRSLTALLAEPLF